MRNTSPIKGSKMLLLAGILALSFSGFSQNPSIKVFEDWNTTSGTQNNMQRAVIRTKNLSGSTYYYLCGSTLNSSGNLDILVQKKNSSGTVLWAQTYGGAGNGNDYATDVQIDNAGNVYVCGTYYKDATDSNNAIIIKYSTVGTHKWTKTYNGTGTRHDIFTALQVAGNVVVAVGTTWRDTTDKYDMLIMRVDSSGNTVWTQTWDYLNLNDGAVNLWNSGTRLYIAGGAQSATTTYKYAVLDVKLSDGSIQGSTVTGGTAFGIDQVTDIQWDPSGNYVYVTGGVLNTGTLYDIKTVKLDTALTILWSQTYASSGAYNDMGTGLAIDQVGNVIVTGYRTTSTTGQDYVTIKYSSAGTQRWVSTFDGGISKQDSATSIVVSPTDTNKIYVTGSSWNGSSKDYWTLKYDGAGNQKWDIGFNNLSNTDDRATFIALDTLGNIIVAGQNKLAWNSHTYTTVKYVEKSTTMHKDTTSFPSSSCIFTQNRGQVIGNDTNLHSEVKYYTIENSPQLYFTDTSVVYSLVKNDTSVTNLDSLFRVDLKFVNSNSDQKIRPLDQRDDYCNFFYDHTERSNVPNYDQLVSFNVWNNVDIIYGSNLAGFKYYFLCKPVGGGGSSSQIDLQYEGADSVRIDGGGQLVIYTPFGNIVQPKAHVWQLDANGNYSALAWQPDYTLLGTDEVGFTNLGSYNTTYPLVIAVDFGNGNYPTMSTQNLLYSGWYGTGQGDMYRDIKVGHDGMVHACGQTSSSSFPTTMGAIQTSYGSGTRDAIVVQYHPNGARKWATYYGGLGWDVAHGINVDDTGSVYFVGETSTQPVSQSIHPFWFVWGSFGYLDTTLNNSTTTNKDGFIVRLSPDGMDRQWATYLGGNGNDYAYDIAISETTGDIWVVGSGDTTGFPLDSSGTWNSHYGGGMIWRFWSQGGVTYSCFIGPPSNSAAIFGVTVDSVGNAVIAGRTGSSFPITAGCAQPIYGGGSYDGFVAKLNGTKDNSLEWATYHGGEDGDAVKAIDISPFGSPAMFYVTGYTFSDSLPFAYPAGAYIDSTLGGQEDAFVAQYDSSGARLWATYYGGTSDEESYDVTTDNYGNIYFVTWTTSSNAAMTCPNASSYCDGSQNGAADAVLIMFSEGSRSLNWSTYFGGSSGETPYAVDCEDTSLYLAGDANSFSNTGYPFEYGTVVVGMGTPYHTNDNAGSFNKAFLAQFGLNPLVTGIPETDQQSMNELNVYPNPSSDNITIAGNVNAKDKLSIEIVDVLGRIVYSENLKPEYNVNKSVDVSNLANGMYVVRVVSDETVYTNKVLIQQ